MLRRREQYDASRSTVPPDVGSGQASPSSHRSTLGSGLRRLLAGGGCDCTSQPRTCSSPPVVLQSGRRRRGGAAHTRRQRRSSTTSAGSRSVAATKHGRCWQEHEGRVVPLFADGAEGVGASSARGVLVARRPDDGRRKGDRVRRGLISASSPAAFASAAASCTGVRTWTSG